LALLRHYGGPTRLLDFTYSPFIAAYFALQKQEAGKDSAVWAISTKWLHKQAKAVVAQEITDDDGRKIFEDFDAKRDGKSFKKMFWRKPPLRFVRVANPMRLNERLTLQQGNFLCPGDIEVSFEENLRALKKVKNNVHKIVIKNRSRTKALEQLRRMNIDTTTLFPGLDGFAESLNTRFVEIGDMHIAREEDIQTSALERRAPGGKQT
jgi:hypothetical protein